MEYARFKCPGVQPFAWIGITSGMGAAIGGSSSSKDKWQRRHKLLVVRN